MENQPIWQVHRDEGAEYLCSILEFLLPEYGRIFGKEVMTAAPCIVYNDPNSKCPRFNHTEPVTIRLSQSSLSFWAQTIYQLSHEMCHYAMHQAKQDKTQTLSWFEEIFCEAFALYALDWSAKNWRLCGLCGCNPGFYKLIERYLGDELLKEGTSGFSECITLEMLKSYEDLKKPEGDRDTHRNERNVLWEEIQRNPMGCRALCYYQNYLNVDGITFDFKIWRQKHGSPLIGVIERIQPCHTEERTKKCHIL
jgi:hypothetical protein